MFDHDENDFCHYLDGYPLEEHYAICRRFLCDGMDWSSISENICQNGVITFDISNVLSCFPHLELDENYKLICYLTREYHGIWGRIAAVKDGDSAAPVIDPKDAWLSKLFHGQHFKLPETAAPPMEAVYNDGSHEGYFEALLCDLFLRAIPYTQFERNNWDIIMTQPPADLEQNWDTRLILPDWRPRAIGGEDTDTILLCRRVIENGLGSSNGRDRIYLTQYNFLDSLKMYHALGEKNKHSMCRGQIDDDKRYNENRKCCVSSSSTILIAEETEYTVK